MTWKYIPSSEIDDHQIGIPFNSFIKHFSKITGRPIQDIFKSLFVGPIKLTHTYECSNGKNINYLSLEDLLKSFRSKLDTKEISDFDRLWRKHAIDLGMTHNSKGLVEYLDKECHLKN